MRKWVQTDNASSCIKTINTWNSICSWLEHIRNLHKEFTLISVIEFNRKCMKLIKFGILVNKTAYQNPSMRDSSISGPGVRESFGNSIEEELGGKFWKIHRGWGSYRKSLPCGWYGVFLEPHNVKRSHSLTCQIKIIFSVWFIDLQLPGMFTQLENTKVVLNHR